MSYLCEILIQVHMPVAQAAASRTRVVLQRKGLVAIRHINGTRAQQALYSTGPQYTSTHPRRLVLCPTAFLRNLLHVTR